MKDTLVFNTGRKYTEDGQTIEASIMSFDDETNLYKISFADKARYIVGIMFVKEFTKEAIMEQYDKGAYTHS